MASIQDNLDAAFRELLPAMVVDGGGAEIVEVSEDNTVTIRLVGSCTVCPSARLSAAAMERALRRMVPELKRVQIVSGDRILNLETVRSAVEVSSIS